MLTKDDWRVNMQGGRIMVTGIALLTALALLATGPAAAADDLSPGDSQAPAAASDRKELELALAQGDFKAGDRHGLIVSLYQGKWFMPKREKVRRCIVKRESGANYRAVSAGGRYRGAYQMNRRLAVGASWMMQGEVRNPAVEPLLARSGVLDYLARRQGQESLARGRPRLPASSITI
jgi:hypothetical protein